LAVKGPQYSGGLRNGSGVPVTTVVSAHIQESGSDFSGRGAITLTVNSFSQNYVVANHNTIDVVFQGVRLVGYVNNSNDVDGTGISSFSTTILTLEDMDNRTSHVVTLKYTTSPSSFLSSNPVYTVAMNI